jgi:hypothetical protein
MAFLKSEYEDLKDLGMTSAEIRQTIKDAKDLKTKQSSLETELNTTKTALTSVNNGYKEVKDKLDELEASSRRQPPPRQEDQKPKTSFIEDEDRAFDERFNERVGPVAMTALTSARNSAKMAAKMSLQGKFVNTPGGRISLSRLWEKWEPEIETDSKQVQLAALGDMTTWINMFNYVKGKHMDELMTEPHTFVESVEQRTDTKVGGERETEEKLNDEENKTIKKMSKYSKNVTPEKYQEIKKKMTFVNV